MDTEHGPQEEYSFIQEKIKEEEFNPRKMAGKIGRLIVMGLFFGCAACVAFFAVKPWVEEVFQKEPNKVELTNEEEEEDPDESESTPPEIIQVEKELTLGDYSVLMDIINDITKEAKKSVVTISGVSEDNNWATSDKVEHRSTAGLIVADNGRELLILGKYSVMKEMKLYKVEFVDGTKQQATFKQKDANLDLAIFSVPKDKLENETKEEIVIAKLGNSNRLAQGAPLFAIGQPFGHKDGVANGIVSSLGTTVLLADGEYDVFVTDMRYAPNASGVLVDIYGSVMGIIDGNLGKAQSASTMMAYSISQIKKEIELMSNGQHIPYAGVLGVMVTEEVSELRGIPKGLYVEETEKDSPAMAAGIQSGDIIQKIGDVEVASLNAYHNALYNLEAGETVKFECQRLGADGYVEINFTVTIGIKE